MQALSTAMLVCKRWRQVAYSTPALWAEFTLRANEVAGGHNAPFALEPLARAAAFLRATHDLLRRVGRHVAAFTAWECSRLPATPAGSAGGWRLAQFLRLLEPATLSALTIDEARWLLNQAPLDPEALELLPRFTHLTALCLMSSSRLQLPPSVPDILQRLPRLVRLRLGFAPPDEATGSAGSLCAAAAWAIGMLTALEWLEVPFMFDTFPKPLPWGGLTRLQHLILVGNLPAGGLRMFPMLSSYDVKFCTVRATATAAALSMCAPCS